MLKPLSEVALACTDDRIDDHTVFIKCRIFGEEKVCVKSLLRCDAFNIVSSVSLECTSFEKPGEWHLTYISA